MEGDDLVRLGGAIVGRVLEDQTCIKIFKGWSNLGGLVVMEMSETMCVEMIMLRWIPL